MKKVDINCDMGESFGRYKLGFDEEAIKYITSANIGCGFHGGDPSVMNSTVKSAGQYNVGIGAHPGYPDLLGFGRRSMKIDPEELMNYVIYQIGALQAFCRVNGMELQHVKPHGALYNDAGADPKIAMAVARAVYSVDSDLILLALAGSELEKAGRETGLRTACEVFADRNYNTDGSLVSRTLPNAMVTDEHEAVSRVMGMIKEGVVTAIDGTVIPVRVDSICVHGDSTGAVDFIKKIRQALSQNGIEAVPMKEINLG